MHRAITLPAPLLCVVILFIKIYFYCFSSTCILPYLNNHLLKFLLITQAVTLIILAIKTTPLHQLLSQQVLAGDGAATTLKLIMAWEAVEWHQ